MKIAAIDGTKGTSKQRTFFKTAVEFIESLSIRACGDIHRLEWAENKPGNGGDAMIQKQGCFIKNPTQQYLKKEKCYCDKVMFITTCAVVYMEAINNGGKPPQMGK